MTLLRFRLLARALPLVLIAPGVAMAQTPPTRAEAAAALQRAETPRLSHYSRRQIDQMVAPIALYPDQLLSQVLMAATYPQQVIEAAQWLDEASHAGLGGDALAAALAPLRWDPSVKALAVFSQIISLMSRHIEWTEALGIAFAMQQGDVMSRVQALRHLAMRAGGLPKVRHLVVRQEGPAIIIVPAEPDRIFVPVYDPAMVYGRWADRTAPPVFLPPPPGFVGEAIESGFGVSVGHPIVAQLWGWSRPDWRAARIWVNRDDYARISPNAPIGPGDTWRHQGAITLVLPAPTPAPTGASGGAGPSPAGTVAPGQAGAVMALPLRAAADPSRIKSPSPPQAPGAQMPAVQEPPPNPPQTPAVEARPTTTTQPPAAQAHPPTPPQPPAAQAHPPAPPQPPAVEAHPPTPPQPPAPPQPAQVQPPAPQPPAAQAHPPTPQPPAAQAPHPPTPPQPPAAQAHPPAPPQPPAAQAHPPAPPQPPAAQAHPPAPPQPPGDRGKSAPVGTSAPQPPAQNHEEPRPHPPNKLE